MTNMAVNMQVLFSGLALGSIYTLVALGFVLIIRATNVVNLAIFAQPLEKVKLRE